MTHSVTATSFLVVWVFLSPLGFGQDAAIISGQQGQASDDRRALDEVFGEKHLRGDVLSQHRAALQMPPEERFDRLLNLVIPHRDSLRLALDFTPANSDPPTSSHDPEDATRIEAAKAAGRNRVFTGGHLVAPAIDLVEVAGELGRLDELRILINRGNAVGEQEIRERLALLTLVDVADQKFAAANSNLAKLLVLATAVDHRDYPKRSPFMFASGRLRHESWPASSRWTCLCDRFNRTDWGDLLRGNGASGILSAGRSFSIP
jgi:hypothetical protein